MRFLLTMLLSVLVICVHSRCKYWNGGFLGYRACKTIGGTLNKVSAITNTVFVGHQLRKAKTRFANWSHAGWRFNDWNRWRMEDGFLCRDDQDCMWLDNGLRCNDHKIDWSVTTDWFNGDSASIVGSCDCVEGFWYSEDQITCVACPDSRLSGMAIFIIVIIFIVLDCILFAVCFCSVKSVRSLKKDRRSGKNKDLELMYL